jgi:hypothetical protein
MENVMENVMEIETDMRRKTKRSRGNGARKPNRSNQMEHARAIRTGQENLNAETDRARSFNRDCKGELELAQIKTGNLPKIKKICYYDHVIAPRPPAGKQLNCQKATQATSNYFQPLEKNKF